MLTRLFTALLLTTGLCTATAGEFVPSQEPIPNRYIVVFDGDALPLNILQTVNSLAKTLTQLYSGRLIHVYDNVLNGFAVELPLEQAQRLALDPRVDFVEQDQVVRAIAIQTDAVWGLDRVDQRSLPLDNRYRYNRSGQGTHIYIIDTGLRTSHSDFRGRIGNGYTAIRDNRGVNDCNGHGTHVAGIAGGSTYGAAKGASIHPVRVLDCQGRGAGSDVIAGIDWVTANHQRPAVANMSLGGGPSPALDRAVRDSVRAGVFYAVAAGNVNTDACGSSPARVDEVLTIGATDRGDRRASFSNTGRCLDLFAPGQEILSTWHTGDRASRQLSGTSMASPHVAGVAALYRAANPGANPAAVNNALLRGATENRLEDVGSGSPNRLLYSLLEQEDSPSPPPDAPAEGPSARFSHSCAGHNCNFDGGQSNGQGRRLVSFHWDFGDGSEGEGRVVEHVYDERGRYTVRLTVTDDRGRSDSSAREVEASGRGGLLCNIPLLGAGC